MKVISKKSVLYALGFVVLGVIINRIANILISVAGLPLYLDSIGTMFVTAVSGMCPGMVVGFITNVIGGISDSVTFYYGTINVLIAAIAGYAANRGWFKNIFSIFKALPFYLLLSIPCSFLSYILYAGGVADSVARFEVEKIHSMGVPVLISQILGDICVEIPDKFLSLVIAFFLVRLVPKSIKREFLIISGRDALVYRKEEKEQRSSLRSQVALVLFISGVAIVIVAFAISYKTYLEARVAGYPDGAYDIYALRMETLLYSGKMLSAVLGLLLCIVSFSMILANQMVVTPLHKMAREMGRFVYDSDTGREDSVGKVEALNICTGNEIEELYKAMLKSVKEINAYIAKTNEQSKTISDLQVNIITTLADIVESRDETTGNHVKRTAEYSAILARKLRESGIYTDILTDEYIYILTIAAPLHDIGKIEIPDAILNKPGRLTEEEFAIIKTHTVLGKKMLENAAKNLGETEYLRMAEDIANYHHEWWDGSKRGYPEGIAGEAIPLSARIMAVADVFDALVSKRPYKEGYSVDKAVEIMVEESGTHFDPNIVMAMINNRKEFEEILLKYSD